MAIPSVQQFSQQPGGGLVTVMGADNALAKALLESKIKGIEADYAPLTVPAKAYSELAYASMVGPQALAKFMGHDPILANMSDDQKNKAIDLLYRAGTGQGTGNALLNLPGHPAQGGGSLSNVLSQRVRDILGQNPQQLSPGQQAAYADQGQAQPQATNALNQRPPIDLSNMRPGDSYTNNSLSPQMVTLRRPSADSGYSYNPDGSNQVASPQEISRIANGSSAQALPSRTFSENTANQADIIAEGKALGEARGKAIADLGKQYIQDVEAMAPLSRLAELTNSPVFVKMKSENPLFLGMQQAALSKIGTPEEQKIIGDFIVDTKSAIANTVNSFQGRAMAKEFDFANTMKVSDNDTLGTMLGKLESLITFKQATMERNDIARKLMSAPYHMNEGEAYKKANESVDMSAIRKDISKNLNAQNKVTDEDIDFMAKKYNISRDEVNKRLKAKGII